jgi:hypothetical protein
MHIEDQVRREALRPPARQGAGLASEMVDRVKARSTHEPIATSSSWPAPMRWPSKDSPQRSSARALTSKPAPT